MPKRPNPRELVGPEPPHAECFLLCDFARAENQKLYIIGGGWDQILPRQLPVDYVAYLATKLIVPGDLLSGAIDVRIELRDKDGELLGGPVYESTMESVPSPLPGQIESQSRLRLVVFMGTEVRMNLKQPGAYTLALVLNDRTVAETSFSVLFPPAVPELR
jgi:hypothetical protein